VILGCGLDLMEVVRFEHEVARRGDSLIEELFSAGERAWCGRRRRAAEGYATAYAAKEALFKALGTGKIGRMAWSDIEVAWPAGSARPSMALSGETAEAARQQGVTGVHVAVTATREHAVAWVVVTGRRSCPGRSHLCSGDLRLSSLRPSTGSGRPELAEGRADGKRPGHPRPAAGVIDEPRVPSPESRPE
jgi:holo-[acyl-carrier protein] synthase